MTRFIILCCLYYQAISHGFDPRIITAQVFVESSFRPAVVNAGCYGLGQVNYKVWCKALNLDRARMLEVNYNLDKAMDILTIYYRQTGDVWRALHRYNCGYKYHSRYIEKVKKAMRKLYVGASCQL